MFDAVKWLGGIGCYVGLLVSIVWMPFMVFVVPLHTAAPIMVLIGPLGFLLVGWVCMIHSKTVSQREVAFMCAVTLVGTLLTFASVAVFPPLLVPLVGFWMLNGLGLAWLLRKWRRMRLEANAE